MAFPVSKSRRRGSDKLVDVLVRICAGPLPPVTVAVAHPDDEAIGASAVLPRLRSSTFVYVTDGAPRNLADALAAGFSTREEYAEARSAERAAALSLAGLREEQVKLLNVPDQEASLHLAQITLQMAEHLAATGEPFVMTHPYEGGHPDHDATAFAVHAACRLLKRQGQKAPEILEFTSYHSRGGALAASEFLPGGSREIVTLELSNSQREFKRRLLECYATQRQTLRWFPIERERFRYAPRYDFTRPPHEGRLFYEQFPWGMTGERFRQLASAALRQLSLEPA